MTIGSENGKREGQTPARPLLVCPNCKLELRLLGIEAETIQRDLYTFECTKCGALEARGVKVQ